MHNNHVQKQSPQHSLVNTVATPQLSFKRQSNANQPSYILATIAMIAALIIFVMQLGWIEIRVDIGGLAGEMLTDVASQEDIWEIIRTYTDPDVSVSFDDIPGIIELVDIITDGLISEVNEFAQRIFAFDTTLTRQDIPDVSGVVDSFTELIMWEVSRATSGLGVISQRISINDLPNIIVIADFVIETIIREGASWGMSPENLSLLQLETEQVQTAEQMINILRIVFVICILLLVLFIFLLVARVRAALTFGQFALIIVGLLSGAFAFVMHFGNRILYEALGEHVFIGAGWYVYAALGLAILGFVCITIYKVATD